jgi:hypothetical protein
MAKMSCLTSHAFLAGKTPLVPRYAYAYARARGNGAAAVQPLPLSREYRGGDEGVDHAMGGGGLPGL